MRRSPKNASGTPARPSVEPDHARVKTTPGLLSAPQGPALTLQRIYFRTAAEQGSFNAAARCLHCTQPAVSEQVRRLERELPPRRPPSAQCAWPERAANFPWRDANPGRSAPPGLDVLQHVKAELSPHPSHARCTVPL
ncbi:MAG TPA: LysR family transcriptional regulator [Solirubrobacteraceae bacterium]